VAQAAADALRQKLDKLRQRIRERYSEIDDTVFDEALRPLTDLVPKDVVSPAAYGQLAANLEAAEGRADKIARQLDEIQTQGKIARIVVNDLVSKPITNEDELDGALDRIREAAASELANGKQVRLA
jgi:predicted  nucleic acid-binding Zn-ribbon protein